MSTDSGNVVHSVVAANLISCKEAISSYPYGDAFQGCKLLWTDSPEDHPVVGKFFSRIEAMYCSGDPAGDPGVDSSDKGAPTLVDMVRYQAHGCNSCIHQSVCAIATHPLMGTLKIVVSACEGHYSGIEDGNDGVY